MDTLPFNDDDIVHLCHNYGVLQLPLLSHESSGRKVVRLSDGIVVKFGLGVTQQEAMAQQLAFKEVNREVLCIPQVYHFFERPDSLFWKTGYLVMEYVEGVTVEQMAWEQPGMLMRIVVAVNAINSIPSKIPGPVSGGVAHHSLWSENGSRIAFQNVHHLEAYLNERLSFFQRETHIREEDLRLCHMDVAPRNFMIDRLGRLYVLDWATAGFFPRYFELWAIEFTQTVSGTSFGPDLIHSLKATPEEMLELENLTLVYRYNSCFAGYDEQALFLLPSLLFL